MSEDVLQAASYKPRYAGTRWDLAYGSYEGVEKFALDELQRMVQRFLPYVIKVVPAEAEQASEHLIVIGTAANNRRIRELAERKLLAVPDQAQGYALASLKSPWGEGRVIVIAAHDPAGVLYGVEDFNARVLAARWPDDPTPARLRQAFDGIPDFSISEWPRVENRGIWTWGYVVYDYRRFIDHMARLRMNMLTLWNDCPPLNAPEIVAYAHSRGVKIIFGFHWGWGLEDVDLANADHRRQIRDHVVRNYRENYRGLGLDGIYFQTLTEHHTLEAGGQSTAELACRLVNETAAALYEIEPDLYIQFGLHATSIQQKYADLASLDPRVVIVWEDAGNVPYLYSPDPAIKTWCGSPEATLEYSKKIATFRPGTEFALVPKGWTSLRWGEEFEHHGPFILGERHAELVRQRLEERRGRWDHVNTEWLKCFPVAAKFYRGILECAPPGGPTQITATALVEDGLFEEAIQPSVALFAETVWNPTQSDAEILTRAMSAYYGS